MAARILLALVLILLSGPGVALAGGNPLAAYAKINEISFEKVDLKNVTIEEAAFSCLKRAENPIPKEKGSTLFSIFPLRI